MLALPPEEQYLVATGRTYFRDLTFDHLHRMQFDLETTGLDPARDRIFMIAVRDPSGAAEVLEADGDGDAAEAGADSRGSSRRCRRPIPTSSRTTTCTASTCRSSIGARGGSACRSRSGGIGAPGLRQRAARRGIAAGEGDARRRVRFVAPGRELIDTLDAVLRHDFATRELPGHGLKAVARHLGIAGAGSRAHPRAIRSTTVYRRDPERVRRYAIADVEEVAGARAHARRRGVRARADGAAALRAARRRRRRRPA